MSVDKPVQKDFDGGWIVLSVKGSEYKDPETKKMVERTENSFKIASKSTQGKEIKLGRSAIQAIVKFSETSEGRAFIDSLPVVPKLEED